MRQNFNFDDHLNFLSEYPLFRNLYPAMRYDENVCDSFISIV